MQIIIVTLHCKEAIGKADPCTEAEATKCPIIFLRLGEENREGKARIYRRQSNPPRFRRSDRVDRYSKTRHNPTAGEAEDPHSTRDSRN